MTSQFRALWFLPLLNKVSNIFINAYRLKIFSTLSKILSSGRYECPRTGNVTLILLMVSGAKLCSHNMSIWMIKLCLFCPPHPSENRRIVSAFGRKLVFFRKSSSAKDISVTLLPAWCSIHEYKIGFLQFITVTQKKVKGQLCCA